LRNFSKLYWAGGDVVSAFAISSSPVDAFFFLVPVADPAAADPVVAAFVPLVVSDLVPADLVYAAFGPLAVSDLVPADLVCAAFVPLAVSDLVPADLVCAAFVPLAVSDLVPADLVSAAHIPLADSFSSNFPSWIHELSKFRIGAQTVLHAQPSFFNSIILLSKHYVQGYIFAAQRVDQ
jgi:hypothetical protein